MQPFKIVWFEDDNQNVEDIKPALIERLKAYSRALEVEWHDKYTSDFDIKMFDGECCLALIDLNLSNGDLGTELIHLIRKNGAYIEILLYSNNPEQLIELTEGKNYIEGIYRHATLTGLQNKILDVIDIALYRETMSHERKRIFDEKQPG